MPLTRSNVVAFTAGVAVGVALATYPRWKHKVAPLVTALREGAAAAFHDAQAASEGMFAGAEPDASQEAAPGPFVSPARNGSGAYATTQL